jgi:hypothetical protein
MSLTVLSPGDRHTSMFVTVAPGPGAPPLPSVAIRVSSQGPAAVVPLIGKRARLPVSLHWGLNRVRLTIAGVPTSTTEVLLSNIAFGS